MLLKVLLANNYMVFFEGEMRNDRWYALEPVTYKLLGWSRTLKKLSKRFPPKMKVIFSKQRVYLLEDLKK